MKKYIPMSQKQKSLPKGQVLVSDYQKQVLLTFLWGERPGHSSVEGNVFKAGNDLDRVKRILELLVVFEHRQVLKGNDTARAQLISLRRLQDNMNEIV